MIKATVIIPTKNPGPLFERVLRAVLDQKAPWDFDVIVIDSGSTDGTLAFCRKHGVTLVEIPSAEFGHGRTRNRAIREAKGEFVVLITHDALPAHENWLEQLIAPMEADPSVAGVFGKHLPYPDCDPYTARDLDAHFRGLAAFGHVVRMEDPDRYARDVGYRQALHFFSDNNAALRRSVWEKIPYPDVEFAEDQAWAKRIIEAGYAKAYAEDAPVFHSHNYSVWEHFRRGYDESRALNDLFGYVLCPSIGHGYRHFFRMTVGDCEYSIRNRRILKDWFWMLRSGWANYARIAGHFLGSRDRDLPNEIRRFLSRDKTMKEGALGASGFIRALRGMVRREKPKKNPLADFRFITNEPIIAKRPRQPADDHVINWVIPDFGIGSGGHVNIFRLIHNLEKAGLTCRVYIVGPTQRGSGEGARNVIRAHFSPIEADVFVGDAFEPAGVTVATSWHTAFWVSRFAEGGAKAYFVQDFEPYFFAPGSQAYFAEQTYRMGFVALTAGDWLAEKLRAEYGMQAHAMGFSYDREFYHALERPARARKRVFFYARPITERRAFELGVLALTELHRQRPETEFVLAGWDLSGFDLPFPHVSEGVVTPQRLAELYRASDAALVISATNLSLLPLELMACGCAVVSNKGRQVEWLLDDNNSVLCDANHTAMATALVNILDDDERRNTLTSRAAEFAARTEWSAEAAKAVTFFQTLIAERAIR